MQTNADGSPVVGRQGDFEGNLLTVGDRVTATSHGYGIPAGTQQGTVVGFTGYGEKVMVHWDGYVYTGNTLKGGGYHSARFNQLRLVKPQTEYYAVTTD